MYIGEYSTFMEWLWHQQHRKDHIGDVARIFKNAVTKKDWEDVLDMVPEDIINEAWREYTNT